MSDYSITRARMYQWVGILLILAVVGGAYWYFQVRAGVTLNTSGISGTAKLSASQNTSITNGLVGLWSFNGQDISGTTAYDRSGSGNNGTLTNGPTKVIGQIGQGLQFDGVNDQVSIPDIEFGGTNPITICSWIKPGTLSLIGAVIVGQAAEISFRQAYSGVEFILNSFSTNDRISTTNVLSLNKWTFACGKYDSGGDISIYIDGVFNASITPTGTYANSATGFTIGYGSSQQYFNGIIDDVRVYNRALSVTEIQSLYDLGQSDKINSSVAQPQGTGRLDSGLAGYWKLDDASGTSATDSSTNGNAGTLTNGPTWTTGQINGAVDFDGTDDYVTLADVDVLDVVDSTNFTLSGWFNRDTFTTDDTILAKSNGQTAADTGYNVYIDDATDKVTFVANDGTDQYKLESTATFTATGWNHYAIVWNDAASGQTKLYINGTPQTGTATGTFANVNSLANALAFRLGAESDAGNPFDGKLDEARIYSRALSDDEISQLYGLTAPTAVDTSLKGYWSFNGQDMSGTTAYDRSGAGNTGTLTNGPTKVIGKIGQGLQFDGTDDYVDVAQDSGYNFTNTTFSVAGWIKTTVGTNRYIFGKMNASHTGGWGVGVGLSTTNKLGVITKQTGSTANSVLRESSSSVADGLWHYFVAVITTNSSVSAGNTATIYIDGVVDQGSLTLVGVSDGSPSSSQNLLLGKRAEGNLFSGSMDELRVYNRALSATEITSLYNQGR